MYVKMVRRTEVPSLMGTRIFSFAGVPKNDLDLTTSHDRVQKLPFFCPSLVKFNQVHVACSSYRNQTLLKDNLKKFDLPLYEWRCLFTDIFVDFFALDFIFIP